MSHVLVDTSAWIHFFRGDPAAIRRIDPLLAENRVAVNGPIYAEILTGARTRPELQLLRTTLRALHWLDEADDVWERVGEARYTLARAGTQAATMDVMIALAASAGGHELLTRDRDFTRIRTAVPFELTLF